MSALKLIGNTPLIRMSRNIVGTEAEVFAKLEMFNPGGSVKDRIALSMINSAEQNGHLSQGGTILEPTSGNTGIGLAIVAAVKGYQLILTMPESMSEERRALLKSYGAELVLTLADKGMGGAVEKANQIKRENPDYFIPQQFNNISNPEIHKQTTAREIISELDSDIDGLVLGVGTGGTITGVGEVLKHKNPNLKIFAVEPKESPVLSGGNPGPHKIQGLGAGFVPQVLKTELIDEVIQVDSSEAYDMSNQLAKQEGLLAGISSGAALKGVLKALKQLPSGARVVTVFPDTGERYLSMAPYFNL
ncbi:cysteine synthase A [Natranaerobius thermophilus]|uniref:Cysteine synthase n=1 Tax=Natranaerobius thermophilus (strain ATCC BAA-1301 / DSM 18059 / JW/NM-WN-LF) TaxID=457570 RepID=B2A152_NATTJ|nr:cysteine synthase A [Natranaerobius thermophilus]ACB84675.1 cysteine synthase [Natranaerobius thermophilus JW/NM-WN-LF]